MPKSVYLRIWLNSSRTVTRDNITVRADLKGWWTLFSEGAEPEIADEDKEFIAEAMKLLPEGPL